MYRFWLSIPLAAVFFAAWTGTPLWLVLKHRDTGLEPRNTQRRARPAGRHRRPPSRRLNLRRVAGIRPASYSSWIADR
jgi:hypothetical protein